MAGLVAFRLARICPRDGVNQPAGKVLHLPEHVVVRLEAARPPYGERVARPRVRRTRSPRKGA